MEKAVHYVTNVADSYSVVETLHRVRFPQRMSMVQGDELLPINIAGSIYWHGRKKESTRGRTIAFQKIRGMSPVITDHYHKNRVRVWHALYIRKTPHLLFATFTTFIAFFV